MAAPLLLAASISSPARFSALVLPPPRRVLEPRDRLAVGLRLDHGHRLINRPGGGALLAAPHQSVDESLDERISIPNVPRDLALDWLGSSHDYAPVPG